MSEPIRAVGFLDLAGYTALTDVHGDQAAVDIVEHFCTVVRASLGHDDVLVKSIGDAVLVHSPSAGALAELAARVCRALDEHDAFPVLRIGLHLGPVIVRDGDLFGGTVNIAARIAAQATADQVLVTAAFVTELDPNVWPTQPLGLRHLKGLSTPVQIVALELCPPPPGRDIDPVCGMTVAADAASPVRVTVDGTLWSFCSTDCSSRWLRQAAQGVH